MYANLSHPSPIPFLPFKQASVIYKHDTSGGKKKTPHLILKGLCFVHQVW